MKRQIISLGLMLAATFSLTNCAKELSNPQTPEVAGTPFEIVVSVADTKTANNEMKTTWVANDEINLFHAVTDGTTYVNDGKFSITEANLAAGKFTGTVNGTLDSQEKYDWFAFYPYTSSIPTPANMGTSGYVQVGAKEQTQTGNSNMDHVAGEKFPLAGVAMYKPGDSKLEIEMVNLASLIQVHVTNNSSAPLTVTSVSFGAETDIVGTYYINFVDMENVTYTSSGANYVYAATVLEVKNGEDIPVGGTADFYIGVKPFTAASGSTLSLGVNTCLKEIVLEDATTFTAGKIKTLNFSYVDSQIPVGISNIKKEATATGASFAVKLEDAVVTYVSGNNAYIQDAEAGILIYASGHGLTKGTKLNGEVTGTVKLYNNLREITAINLTKVEKITGTDIPETVLTLAELNADGAYDKYENMRITIRGVEMTAEKEISKDGQSYNLFFKNTSVTGYALYNIIDITGYPTKYNSEFQLNVWEDASVLGATMTTFSGFGNIEVAIGDTKANKAIVSSGATVTYTSSASNIAIVDADGNVTGIAEGDAVITASVEAYNGYPAAEATCTVKVLPAGTTAEPVWTLVTDASSLAAGDQIIIAAKNANYALSTTQNSNNRAQADITKSGNTATFTSSVQIITLENGTKTGTFAFNVGSSNYLYAASSSKNYLKTGSKNDNASWTIEVNSTGVATIKAQGTSTRNWLRYNSSNNPPLFSCYGSGQADVCIYKLQ